MKYICLTLLITASLISIGCDTPHELNWTKTAKQQNMKIGDVIKVGGLCYQGLADYRLAKDKNGRLIEDYEKRELVWIKQEFGGKSSKKDIHIHDPNDETEQFNPLAPISVVVCTVYNPSYYESLKRLSDMYPAERLDYDPTLIHHIEFTGEVYSFEKYELRILDKPAVYLNCVRINIEDINVISTKTLEIRKEIKGEKM